MGKRLKSRIPAKRVPDAVERWVRHYEENRNDGEQFNDFVERVGARGVRGPRQGSLAAGRVRPRAHHALHRLEPQRALQGRARRGRVRGLSVLPSPLGNASGSFARHGRLRQPLVDSLPVRAVRVGVEHPPAASSASPATASSPSPRLALARPRPRHAVGEAPIGEVQLQFAEGRIAVRPQHAQHAVVGGVVSKGVADLLGQGRRGRSSAARGPEERSPRRGPPRSRPRRLATMPTSALVSQPATKAAAMKPRTISCSLVTRESVSGPQRAQFACFGLRSYRHSVDGALTTRYSTVPQGGFKASFWPGACRTWPWHDLPSGRQSNRRCR